MGRGADVVGVYLVLAVIGLIGWTLTTSIERLPLPDEVVDVCANKSLVRLICSKSASHIFKNVPSDGSLAPKYIVTLGVVNGHPENFAEWQNPSSTRTRVCLVVSGHHYPL